MQRFVRFLSDHGLTAIIVVKIAVVSFVVLGGKRALYFGDAPIMAAQEAPEKEKNAAKVKNAKINPKISESALGGESEETGKKSFLDDLLNLPEINSGSIKKEEIGRYLTMIERKKRQVEDRIIRLSDREKQLRLIESSIETKLKKLEDEMKFFADTQQKEKQVKDERLTELTEFYSKMPAKKAAPVFEKMDRDLVVALFKVIPKKQTMQILALVKPEKSVELTEYFGRIRSAREYDILKEINVSLRKEFAQCKSESVAD